MGNQPRYPFSIERVCGDKACMVTRTTSGWRGNIDYLNSDILPGVYNSLSLRNAMSILPSTSSELPEKPNWRWLFHIAKLDGWAGNASTKLAGDHFSAVCICYGTASCLIPSHLINHASPILSNELSNTSVWLCYGTAPQPLILSLWSYQLCLSHLIKQTIYPFPSHHCLALWMIL